MSEDIRIDSAVVALDHLNARGESDPGPARKKQRRSPDGAKSRGPQTSTVPSDELDDEHHQLDLLI